MKKTALSTILAAVILGVLVTPGSAQNGMSYMLTGQIGYARLSDLTNEAINGVEKNTDNPTPDGSIAVGGGVFYPVIPELAVGAEVSWLDFGTQTIDSADDSYSAIPFTGQALYMIPTNSMVTPFATGGLGLYHLMNKEEGTSTVEASSDVFGFNVGGGVKYDTDMGIGLGVDVRFHMAINPNMKGDTAAGERSVETSDWKMLTVMGRVFF